MNGENINMAIKWKLYMVTLLAIFTMASCKRAEPQAIKINKDKCDFCEMTISNGKFAAEILTQKGRVYKFDDLQCMLRYKTENNNITIQTMYVNDYTANNKLIEASTAYYLKHESFKSPMRGNYAAFASETICKQKATELMVDLHTWEQLIK